MRKNFLKSFFTGLVIVIATGCILILLWWRSVQPVFLKDYGNYSVYLLRGQLSSPMCNFEQVVQNNSGKPIKTFYLCEANIDFVSEEKGLLIVKSHCGEWTKNLTTGAESTMAKPGMCTFSVAGD